MNRWRVVLGLTAILATSSAEAQQGGIAGISPEAFGAKTWREGGMDAGALPLTGNRLWDVRLASDGVLYYWDGAGWVAIAGGITNGSGLPPTAADVTVADAGGWFTSANVEAALQEIGADPRWTDARSPLAHEHSTGDVTGGIFSPERLGSGTPAAGSYLDGTGAWVVLPEAGGVTDHGALTGLADDDHSQYPLLAGRAAGQTITGGTGSGEGLALQSTANVTKGMVIVDGGQGSLQFARWYRPNGNGFLSYDNNNILSGADTITANSLALSSDTARFQGGEILMASGLLFSWTSANSWQAGARDTSISRSAAGMVRLGDALRLVPRTAPPVTCGAANTEGALYTDDSHALCYCNGTAWTNLTPGDGGTCS